MRIKFICHVKMQSMWDFLTGNIGLVFVHSTGKLGGKDNVVGNALLAVNL